MYRYDWTALHYAATEGQFGIVKLLLAHGVDVKARDKDGVTAAYRAYAAGHRDVVFLIQSVAADTDIFPIVFDDDDNRATQVPEEQPYVNVEEFTMPQGTTGECSVRSLWNSLPVAVSIFYTQWLV